MTQIKFTIGDLVTIIDHTTKEFLWCKGTITSMRSLDDISVYIDKLRTCTKVNDRQLMPYEQVKEFLIGSSIACQKSIMTGADEDDFTEWDLDILDELDIDLPLTPDEANAKCVCDMTDLMRYGCQCITGKKQLKSENKGRR